jgi:hypothetical protein
MDTKIQILKQMGYIRQNIIKTLIKIYVTETLQEVRQKHFFDTLIEKYDKDFVQQTHVSWLSTLFNANNIDISLFFAKFLAIHSMSLPKINSFVLKGPTNTGKTLLLSLLMSDTLPKKNF